MPGDSADSDQAIQLLTPAGERLEHPDYPLDLTAEQVRGLYRDLVMVRRADRAAVALARQGELALWPSSLGQEAAQVGSARAMDDQDMAFSSYREHGVAYCRGVPMIAPLGLFRGVHHGWKAADGSLFPYAIVVGSQPLQATGYAMGIQRDEAAGRACAAAVVAYFGDGAMSQGDVSEALVFASVFSAPVVFFCQNNQWAISAPAQRQSRIPLYQRARGFGLPGLQVDGNDVLACLAVTRKALAAARSGQGPVLIEALTYRMDPHTTTDDPSRYRSGAEVDAWRRRDPIERVRTYLLASQLADAAFLSRVEAEADEYAADLRAECLQLPDPSPSAIFENVYAEPHPMLAAEQQELAAYLASFDDAEDQA